MLSGESLDAPKVSHGRYFLSVAELARRGLAMLEAPQEGAGRGAEL